jgi:hypothetical protein
MLRAGKSLRFTPDEVDEFRSLGLDFEGVRTQDDIEQALAGGPVRLPMNALICWTRSSSEMAKVKGVKPPARLTTVVSGAPSAGSPRQS